MTNQEKFDAIVIGAGLGGLSAAGYLAKAGKKVLVLEHHAVPGGYAHEFRRGHYRFEVALHALDGAGPGGWAYDTLRDLDVLDQVKFHRLDPLYTADFPDVTITAHADPFRYEAGLIKQFPAEAANLRRLIDDMIATYYDVRRFTADGEQNRRPSMAEMPAVYPNMLRAMTMTWADFMAEYIGDEKLKGVLSALWAYYGLPPSQLPAATFIFPWVSYHLFGGYYPEGGSMAMSRALEATIKRHGGQIRYRQTVNRIVVEEGRATAVETEKGLRVAADLIISNANAPDTMLKMVGAEHLPANYAAKVDAPPPALSNLVVYLGLKRDLLAEGWTDHEFFTFADYDLEAGYQAVQRGDFGEAGMVIAHYNHFDPTCAPEGSSVISLTSLAPWDYADQWGTGGNLTDYRKNPHYQELKTDAAEKLITEAEKHLPGLRAAIVYQEVATPLTNHRYTLNPGGSIYGSVQSLDNMYRNRLKPKTPIANLFMAGAWVFAGGMSAALLSGRNVSQMALAQLNGETAVDLTDAEEQPTVTPVASPPAPKPVAAAPVEAGEMRHLNLKQTLAGMPFVFNAAVAGDLTADIQFNVSGDQPGAYFLRINGGECTFHEGEAGAPKLTINTPSEVWLKISRGEMNGQTAFMTRKYTVKGDLGLLMKMNKLFKAG